MRKLKVIFKRSLPLQMRRELSVKGFVGLAFEAVVFLVIFTAIFALFFITGV